MLCIWCRWTVITIFTELLSFFIKELWYLFSYPLISLSLCIVLFFPCYIFCICSKNIQDVHRLTVIFSGAEPFPPEWTPVLHVPLPCLFRRAICTWIWGGTCGFTRVQCISLLVRRRDIDALTHVVPVSSEIVNRAYMRKTCAAHFFSSMMTSSLK